MDHIIDWIQAYGYWIVFFGSLVEGESVILTASVMASWGVLSLPKIMIVAFIGTLSAEWALFYLGRYYGKEILQRFPRFKEPAERAYRLLHKWDMWFILTCRFVYGIRTISPIVIGSSGISPSRFIPLNFLAAAIWTVVSCSAGYFLGDLVKEIGIQVFMRYFSIIALSLVFGIVISVVVIRYWRRTKGEEAPREELKPPFDLNEDKEL